VYVRPVPGGPDISTWLKKVVFVLHETFPNPVRNVESAPFEMEETGYGGFFIVVKLYFQPIASEKQQQRQHYLQLEAYGDEALMAEQARTGLVRSEIVEFIEFNEPTEALWDALTSEAQWDYLTPGRGKGKGKGKGRGIATNVPSAEQRSVALPDKVPHGSIYSRDTEDALLTVLKNAMKKCEDMSEEAAKKSKEVNEQLAKVKEGTDIDAKLLELHEKVPHKKK
jgi:YEATS domain-containing protein 4